jgi:hypothetical protein
MAQDKPFVREAEASPQLRHEAELLMRTMLVALASRERGKSLEISFDDIDQAAKQTFMLGVDAPNKKYIFQIVTVN